MMFGVYAEVLKKFNLIIRLINAVKTYLNVPKMHFYYCFKLNSNF